MIHIHPIIVFFKQWVSCDIREKFIFGQFPNTMSDALSKSDIS